MKFRDFMDRMGSSFNAAPTSPSLRNLNGPNVEEIGPSLTPPPVQSLSNFNAAAKPDNLAKLMASAEVSRPPLASAGTKESRSTNPMLQSPMNPVLARFAKAKNFSPEQVGRLSQYGTSVAAVESRGDYGAHQMGGGPGRGAYQVELSSGQGSGRNLTGAKRLQLFEQQYGEIPMTAEDRAELSSADPNYAKLSPAGQDSVFYADLAMGPVKTQDLADGTVSAEDTWLKHHWAGSDSKVPKQRKHWAKVHSRNDG